ncbi:dynein light chain type 1 domain-containing protein [Ditylenchus destructor]|uniref:Dynein light chain type 1 domain-containing protein n=1 Tax=Ditylenchus destructor TaxID=166010 RepID=A0AAD4R5B7_9BILA|nr:dynein light chain type 1 domain-containing protein [Ditylenchus destructor]
MCSNLSKKKQQAAINFAIRAWKRHRRDPHANTLIANCIVSEMSAQYKFTWKCICGRDFSVDISSDCSDATTSKRKRRSVVELPNVKVQQYVRQWRAPLTRTNSVTKTRTVRVRTLPDRDVSFTAIEIYVE